VTPSERFFIDASNSKTSELKQPVARPRRFEGDAIEAVRRFHVLLALDVVVALLLELLLAELQLLDGSSCRR
jgi:hypothetical protein